MKGAKTIHDPVHGNIKVDGVFLEVLDSHEMQRLRYIRQLGFGTMAFPGANHTRFEHCLGTYHLAGRMADAIGLDDEDASTVRMAALLHDICHPPFSHTMEGVMERYSEMDHMEMARALIMGTVPTHMKRDGDILGDRPPLREIIEPEGISAEAVCDLIQLPHSKTLGIEDFGSDPKSYFRSKDYMHQIIHGPVDADQMDYLVRDAHYTGVSHGAIDLDRIISLIRIHNDRLVVDRGGIVAAEGLMVSRALMYSSVYFHRTVRIAEMMFRRATEMSGLDLSELYLMTDADLSMLLIQSGGKSSQMARHVFNRRLYKKAFMQPTIDLDEDVAKMLLRYTELNARKRLETEIADAAGIDPDHVMLDIPLRSALSNMLTIGKTDVSVLDFEGKVRPITRISPVAKALQSRDTLDWAMMVAAPEDDREAVCRATRKILSL
jgi:uncharacterized protein